MEASASFSLVERYADRLGLGESVPELRQRAA